MTLSRVLFFTCILSFISGSAFAKGKGEKLIVERERLESVFTKYISERFSVPEKNIRLGSFRSPRMPLPNPPRDIRVEERRGRQNGKRLLLKVTFIIDDNRRKTSFISLPFKTFTKRVVSKNKLMRGDVLTSGDISTKKSWADHGSADSLPETYFIGKEVLKNLKAGEPLKRKYFGSVPIIRRGDLVNVLFEKNGIKINTKGVARGDASLGDSVRVLNNFSKKVVIARVLEKDLVSVEF